MEGAATAMTTGEVDLNRAKEHHSLWVEVEEAKAKDLPHRVQPADEQALHATAGRNRRPGLDRAFGMGLL
jgi:hypothetical protein